MICNIYAFISCLQCKQENDGTCSLTINYALPSDKGVYTAKAVNSVGEAKCFSQLIVKPSINTENTNPTDVHVAERKPITPTFTELFADRTVVEGETTKFECVVTAKPTPKVCTCSLHGNLIVICPI